MNNQKITPNIQNKFVQKPSIYDQQLNFIKYIERRDYAFKGGPKNNPLMPLYSINKSDIILPKSGFTKPENDICTKLVSSVYNKLDKKPVNCVKFFSNSKKVLYGTTTGYLTVCDIYNSFDLRKYHQLDSSPSIRALQFRKDESFLITGDKNGIITYFRNIPGEIFQKTQNIQLHNDTITDISFSINSSKFVTSSDDKTSKIVDFISGKNELIFKEHLSDVKSCEWNPYRNIIVSGGKDQLVEIWDPNSGDECIDEFNGLMDEINLQFSFKFPKIKLPKIKSPKIKLPKLKFPKLPHIKWPKIHLRKLGLNLRKLRLNLHKMKLPKIKLGPKTKSLIEKITKGLGQGVAKLKDLGLWEPLIGIAKQYGLQKASELCMKHVEDEQSCQQIVDGLGKVTDKITGTGEE